MESVFITNIQSVTQGARGDHSTLHYSIGKKLKDFLASMCNEETKNEVKYEVMWFCWDRTLLYA